MADARDRFTRGAAKMRELDPSAPDRVAQTYKDIAPELTSHVIEFMFGDIYARPGLDLRSRQIATIAALTALGTAQPQLKFHIQSALNIGLTREEIIEVITQISAFAGIPAAINGALAAKEVFAAIDNNKE